MVYIGHGGVQGVASSQSVRTRQAMKSLVPDSGHDLPALCDMKVDLHATHPIYSLSTLGKSKLDNREVDIYLIPEDITITSKGGVLAFIVYLSLGSCRGGGGFYLCFRVWGGVWLN